MKVYKEFIKLVCAIFGVMLGCIVIGILTLLIPMGNIFGHFIIFCLAEVIFLCFVSTQLNK